MDPAATEVHEMLEEFWALNDVHELVFVCDEVKTYLPSFLKPFHCLEQRRMLNEKQISDILEYAGYDSSQSI